MTLMHKSLIALMLAMSVNALSTAQLGFSHELGIITGPVAFQSDYGERYDFDTNKGNVGIGVGLIHYINFAYRADCDCYSRDTYWNDHFKIRSEIGYHVTTLNHLGPEAEKPSVGGLQLRSMQGKAKVFEAGAHIEWYPLSIRDFQSGYPKWAPYIGVGAHYVNYRPEATSSLGPLNNPVTTFRTFIDRIDTSQGSAIAIIGDLGVRYKVSPLSDILISSKWHYYVDDNYVDGLSPRNVNNRANDWIWWFNVGYIFYL
ncbi:THC0290_0291 family protein [Nonlabens xiamenensis]|uniref:THC0290_0291 family protein n=1 Tax=Nonlabens xiamenensis TaxID=2341043 RepID=UPI001F0CA926|nr:glutamate dehydrogenase [Nonlabens xiamenensis]